MLVGGLSVALVAVLASLAWFLLAGTGPTGQPAVDAGAEEPAAEVALPVGTTTVVAAPSPLTAVTQVADEQHGGTVQFAATDTGSLIVSAPMDAPLGTSELLVAGTGCIGQECEQPFTLKVTTTVLEVQAPVNTGLDGYVPPSPDRVASAIDTPLPGARALTDELLAVVGTPDEPGSRADADSVAEAVNAVVAGGWEDLGIYQLRWNHAQDIESRLAELQGMEGVDGGELSLLVAEIELGESTEPQVPGDWKEEPDGDESWPYEQLRAPQAWGMVDSKGSEIRVGIVDGGLVPEPAPNGPGPHPDIAVQERTGENSRGFREATHTGVRKLRVTDHATHVAGLACAKQDDTGIVGTAWGCQLISDGIFRLWESTETLGLTDKDKGAYKLGTAIDALQRVIVAGAQVVNLSIGFTGDCLTEEESDESEAYLRAGPNNINHRVGAAFRQIAQGIGNNVVFTVAAGNSCAPGVMSPYALSADLDNVIAVSAVNSDGQLASFSNWGGEVAAGGGVRTPSDGGSGTEKQDGVVSTFSGPAYGSHLYGTMSGTSHAAPLVAGVAALVWAAHPEYTAAQVGRCIVDHAGIQTGVTPAGVSPYPTNRSPRIPGYPGGTPIVDAAAAVACDTAAANAPISTTIGAGGWHTCGLDTTGQAWCWGRDERGQLGDGEDDRADEHAPVAVAGDHVLASISAGYQHTCGLDTTGQAWCWGHDEYGGVGDGDDDQADEAAATPVGGEHTFTMLSAGGFHTCALDASGRAWCWGWDEFGQVGNGDDGQPDKYSPVAVAGDHTFTSITVGGWHSCGIDQTGQAWCWGLAGQGRIGDGDDGQTNKYTPVAVAGNHTFSTITGGYRHTCGLDSSGRAWCWGEDRYGAVGDGDDGQPDKYAPVAVDGNHAFTSLDSGYTHACGIDTAGQAWCWGSDRRGQLGDGDDDATNEPAPVKVGGNHMFTSIHSGQYHSCAIDATGQGWCWGLDGSGQATDQHGQVGDGYDDAEIKHSPTQVSGGQSWLAGNE